MNAHQRHLWRERIEDCYQNLFSINTRLMDLKYGTTLSEYSDEIDDINDILKDTIKILTNLKENK